MSNYTKSTDFASKDSLASGNAAKIVKGTEIDTEFNNIAIAVATKADLASPTFTGTPSLPTGTTGVTQSTSDDSTKLATTEFVQDLITAVKSALYPVGSIYTNSSVSTNPGTLLGFGTWTAFGAGRVMVGFDSGNSLFDTAEETGGSADAILVSHTHTATVTDPGHLHSYTRPSSTQTLAAGTNSALFTTIAANTGSAVTGISVSNSTEGSSATNANYQPYITVYMWKRTA
jgi:hypothetical protein